MDIFHYPHSPTNTLQRDEFWERVCVPGVPGHAARLDGPGRRQEARGESRRHRRLQQHARLPQHLREITVIYYILDHFKFFFDGFLHGNPLEQATRRCPVEL